MGSPDPSSYSNHDVAKVKSQHLDWKIDFESQIISGAVTITAEAVADKATEIVLDVKKLDITSIATLEGAKVDFTYNEPNTRPEVFGVPMHVAFGKELSAGETFVFKIEYSTTSGCTAVQFLTPEQTADKNHPYLFSQCQAIHARSLVPCQDTPGVKSPYTCNLTIPSNLNCVVSALRKGTEPAGEGLTTYKFEQPIPTPSYLIAIAVGDIVEREIGPRSSVWSEPSLVDACAAEFDDTESFLQAGEDLMGPYVWGRYDLLVLPPSFPFGGMENPNVTFVTPSLLTGDKSLVSVVAHEIAHSWAGNLVTPTTWESFALNEGFTVFSERKIVAAVSGGRQVFEFDSQIGHNALTESIDEFGHTHGATCLCTTLINEQGPIDPDDYFSSVPYMKGFAMLYYLEKLVGGPEVFEPFYKTWFQTHKYTSTTLDNFQKFFTAAFPEESKQVDWDAWFNKPGMPPVANQYDTTLSQGPLDLAKVWAEGGKTCVGSEISEFNARQIMLFLEEVKNLSPAKGLPVDVLDKMDELYSFQASTNAEISFRFLVLALSANRAASIPAAVAFATKFGRMKFTRPIYRLLNVCDPALAKATFLKHKESYHPICQEMVGRDLDC